MYYISLSHAARSYYFSQKINLEFSSVYETDWCRSPRICTSPLRNNVAPDDLSLLDCLDSTFLGLSRTLLASLGGSNLCVDDLLSLLRILLSLALELLLLLVCGSAGDGGRLGITSLLLEIDLGNRG